MNSHIRLVVLVLVVVVLPTLLLVEIANEFHETKVVVERYIEELR